MIITFDHKLECDWFLLSTVTYPIRKGCAHQVNVGNIKETFLAVQFPH